jgi:hypothetical protein
MKAERRHELQTNTLALWLRWRAPQLAQEHGSKILLIFIGLALAVVLIRYRINAPIRAAADSNARLALARTAIDQLRNLGRFPGDSEGILRDVRDALNLSDDPLIQAKGYLLTGDYYWALANWPELPGAATQPTLRPAFPQPELLAKAEEAFLYALKIQAAGAVYQVNAHMGLAAIAEMRGSIQDRDNLGNPQAPANPHWATATQHYQAVSSFPDAPEVLKNEAKFRLDQLTQLQKPTWVENPAPDLLSTQPTTGPATAGTVSPKPEPAPEKKPPL